MSASQELFPAFDTSDDLLGYELMEDDPDTTEAFTYSEAIGSIALSKTDFTLIA